MAKNSTLIKGVLHVEPTSSAPTNPEEGDLYFHTTEGLTQYRGGSFGGVAPAGSSTLITNTKVGADTLGKTNDILVSPTEHDIFVKNHYVDWYGPVNVPFERGVWLDGAGSPGVGLGNTRDGYFDTSNGDYYAKTAVWTQYGNVPSTPNVWLSGSGVPTAAAGINPVSPTEVGDIYWDTNSPFNFYIAGASYGTTFQNLPSTSSTWLVGAGTPTPGAPAAVTGDVYLDTTTGQYYHWDGSAWIFDGTIAPPVTATTYSSGAGAPSPSNVFGDVYLDTTTGDLYQNQYTWTFSSSLPTPLVTATMGAAFGGAPSGATVFGAVGLDTTTGNLWQYAGAWGTAVGNFPSTTSTWTAGASIPTPPGIAGNVFLHTTTGEFITSVDNWTNFGNVGSTSNTWLVGSGVPTSAAGGNPVPPTNIGDVYWNTNSPYDFYAAVATYGASFQNLPSTSSTWLVGAGTPTPGAPAAVTGDVYLDTTTGQYYHWDGSAWQLDGTVSPPIVATSYSSGAGAPPTATSFGDVYFNTTNGDLYQSHYDWTFDQALTTTPQAVTMTDSGAASPTAPNTVNTVYLDTATGGLYQYLDSWQSITTVQTVFGIIWTGTGVPTSAMHPAYDIYLDIVSGSFYHNTADGDNWSVTNTIAPGPAGSWVVSAVEPAPPFHATGYAVGDRYIDTVSGNTYVGVDSYIWEDSGIRDGGYFPYTAVNGTFIMDDSFWHNYTTLDVDVSSNGSVVRLPPADFMRVGKRITVKASGSIIGNYNTNRLTVQDSIGGFVAYVNWQEFSVFVCTDTSAPAPTGAWKVVDHGKNDFVLADSNNEPSVDFQNRQILGPSGAPVAGWADATPQLNMLNNQITNAAPGVNPTDVATVSQLPKIFVENLLDNGSFINASRRKGAMISPVNGFYQFPRWHSYSGGAYSELVTPYQSTNQGANAPSTLYPVGGVLMELTPSGSEQLGWTQTMDIFAAQKILVSPGFSVQVMVDVSPNYPSVSMSGTVLQWQIYNESIIHGSGGNGVTPVAQGSFTLTGPGVYAANNQTLAANANAANGLWFRIYTSTWGTTGVPQGILFRYFAVYDTPVAPANYKPQGGSLATEYENCERWYEKGTLRHRAASTTSPEFQVRLRKPKIFQMMALSEGVIREDMSNSSGGTDYFSPSGFGTGVWKIAQPWIPPYGGTGTVTSLTVGMTVVGTPPHSFRFLLCADNGSGHPNDAAPLYTGPWRSYATISGGKHTEKGLAISGIGPSYYYLVVEVDADGTDGPNNYIDLTLASGLTGGDGFHDAQRKVTGTWQNDIGVADRQLQISVTATQYGVGPAVTTRITSKNGTAGNWSTGATDVAGTISTDGDTVFVDITGSITATNVYETEWEVDADL